VLASQVKLCARCKPGSLLFATDVVRHPAWIASTEFHESHAPRDMPTHYPAPARCNVPLGPDPELVDIAITHTMPFFAGKRVLWWAALPDPLHSAQHPIPDPYGKSLGVPNSGVAQVQSDGVLTIRAATPAAYMAHGRRWPRHVHFVVESPGGQTWDTTRVFTMAAWPGSHPAAGYHTEPTVSDPRTGYVDMAEIALGWMTSKRLSVSPGTAVRIGLPGQMMQEANDLHISGTNVSDAQLSLLASQIGESPCVVYGARAACPLANFIAQRLLLRGCSNLFLFPGGLDAWAAAGMPVHED